MESFSTPPCTPNPSGEDSAVLADDQESAVTTPAPSPGNSSVTPASCGSSFVSRRRQSSFAPSSPSGNNGTGGDVTGSVEREAGLSKLPASTARASTAQPHTSTGLEPQSYPHGAGEDLHNGRGPEGGRRSGEEVGKVLPSRRRSASPPSKIDPGGLRSPANTSRGPVVFARCGIASHNPELEAPKIQRSIACQQTPFVRRPGGSGAQNT